jgi:hypothetical protein
MGGKVSWTLLQRNPWWFVCTSTYLTMGLTGIQNIIWHSFKTPVCVFYQEYHYQNCRLLLTSVSLYYPCHPHVNVTVTLRPSTHTERILFKPVMLPTMYDMIMDEKCWTVAQSSVHFYMAQSSVHFYMAQSSVHFYSLLSPSLLLTLTFSLACLLFWVALASRFPCYPGPVLSPLLHSSIPQSLAHSYLLTTLSSFLSCTCLPFSLLPWPSPQSTFTPAAPEEALWAKICAFIQHLFILQRICCHFTFKWVMIMDAGIGW